MSSDSNDDAPLADRVQAGDHHALPSCSAGIASGC